MTRTLRAQRRQLVSRASAGKAKAVCDGSCFASGCVGVNGARNFPNYGEVKFPSLAGGVISRPVDQGLRFSAAVHDV